MLAKELKENGSYNKDVSEMVTDLSESADVAVELVCDLLTCDKIESGILKLDKGVIRVWSLLHRTAKPFFLQVTPTPFYSCSSSQSL